MAVTQRSGIVEGKDIMVFCNFGEAGYKKTVAATSHKFDKSAETKTIKRVTKDATSSKWQRKIVTGKSATITVNQLFDVTPDACGYDAMNDAFYKGEPVKVKHAFTDEKGKYEEGMYVITKISVDSPAEGDATMSVTLESTGEIEKKGGDA